MCLHLVHETAGTDSGLSSSIARRRRRMFDVGESRQRSSPRSCRRCQLPESWREATVGTACRDCGGREAGWFICRRALPDEVPEPQLLLRPHWNRWAQHRLVYFHPERHCRSGVQSRRRNAFHGTLRPGDRDDRASLHHPSPPSGKLHATDHSLGGSRSPTPGVQGHPFIASGWSDR